MNDNCRTFDVDPLTREVVFPPDAGTIAVASDEAVRAIKIKVARAYHGVDLSEFKFRVNYVNAAGETGVQLVSAQEDSFGELTVEWVPRRHVTQAPGTVRFVLCAVRHGEDGLTVAQEYNTRVATFDVAEGLEVEGDAELEERLDWVWKVVADCEAAAGAAGEAIAGIDAKVGEACEEIDAKLDEACAKAEEEMRAAEEDRALAELERAEAEAQRAAQFAIMEQKTRDWLRYICQPGEYDPDTGRPTIAEPKANVFYFVPTPTPTDESIYQEWMWVPEEERWESFGSAKLTVTPATPDQLAAVLDGTDDGNGGGEVVNLTGWRSVVPRLKAMFASIVHKHSGADITDGTVTSAKLASGAVTQAKIADGSVSLTKCDQGIRDSLSQESKVVKDTANPTHKISQILLYRDGRTMHVSGVLQCVYAHTGEYTRILADTGLPAPRCGIAYCDTPAGSLAICEGEIKVHGGTVGTTYRFHDSYAV